MCRCLQYVFVLMIAVVFSAAPLPAADQSWTGSVDTDFTKAGNWAPGGNLLSTDDYYVNIVGATSPVLVNSATVGKLHVGTNYGGSMLSGKVIVNYSELTANDEVCIGGNANTADTSYLEVTSGVFTFARGVGGDVRVGYQGGNGQMNLYSGSTVNINNGGRLFIGDQTGKGQLNLDFSTVNLANNVLVLGCGSGAEGTATLNNVSTLNINGGMFVGDGGTAYMTIANYSTVTNVSSLTGGNVKIGRLGGNGTLDLAAGNYSQHMSDMVVGTGAGSTGEVKVAAGSNFNFASSGTLSLGHNGGQGTVTKSGGTFYVTNMTLGSFDNSHGTFNMTGGTINKTGDLRVGFDRGFGTMTMGAGTVFNSTGGAIEIGRNSTLDNKLSMSGGEFNHKDFGTDVVIGDFGGKGTLEMTGGTFNQSTGSLYLGNVNYEGRRAQGYLNISGSAAYNFSSSAGTVYVGNFDCDGTINLTGGSMRLSDGAALKVGTSTESTYASSVGTINMNGGTLTNGLSTSTPGATYIGSGWGNYGTLNMSNGATFNHGSSSNCLIGDNLGTGRLTMVGSDAGVEPAIVTTFNCPEAVRVGNGGTGTIEMHQNSVLNTGYYLVIGGGNSSSAVGSLNMTGNALINRTGGSSMFIGENLATGHATMSGTSSITSSTADLEVGKRGGVGDLTMNGGSSITLDTKTMHVGFGGTGVVTMNGSSDITAKNLNIGQYLRDGAGTVEDPFVYTRGVGSLNIGEGVPGENPTITLLTGGVMNLGYSLGSTKKNNEIPCTGTVVMKGGLFDAGAVDPVTLGSTLRAWFGCGSGASATWTQDGGTAIMPPVDVAASDSSSVVGGSATFNFNGGVFATNGIRVANTGDKGAKGSLTINFNGGTLLARQSTTYFIYRRNMPAVNCHVNVTSNGGTIDSFGSTGRFALGAEIREVITSTGTGNSGPLTFIDTNTTAPNTGVITLSGNNAGFLGNIIITGGTLAGGGNIGSATAITPSGDNAFGFGSADRTITVETGGTLAFRHTNMYAGDYSATAVPTILVNGGTLAVQPIIGESGSAPNYVYTYAGTRAAVNNVTLNNGTMTSMTAASIGSNSGAYAWNLNGTLTSKGTSTINYAASSTPGAPAAVAGLIALQSGDMANPNTTFDVQDGTLSVSSTLTDGLSIAGVPRATGLTKTGEGTMTLLADAAYTGNTTVLAGTFQALNINTPAAAVSVTGPNTVLMATSIVADTLSLSSANNVAAVPEPSMIMLLILGALSAILAYRRRG